MVHTTQDWNNDLLDDELESECMLPDDDSERDEPTED